MGRPLKRKNFGPLDSTTSTTGYPDTGDGRNQHGFDTTSASTDREKGYNIPVWKARVGAAADGFDMDVAETDNDLYILEQKGARRFRVFSAANGIGVCTLVNDDGSSEIGDNEMVLRGFIGGNPGAAGTAVYIRKISGKKAYDFSGNAYTWYVDDDSSQNVLVLTAI